MSYGKSELVESAYKSVFGEPGRRFGSSKQWYQGVYNPIDGVQWHIVIDRMLGITRFGVNLEGLKYDDWPIDRFISRELESPRLLEFKMSLKHADSVYIYFQRDAWQVAARPLIDERFIGGKVMTLSEVSHDQWKKILQEAHACLDRNGASIRRARQIVTLSKSGPTEMEVSPHLMIYTKLWSNCPAGISEAVSIINEKMGLLQPLYGFVESRSHV